MGRQSLYHTLKRYNTLRTHKISALPIVILMPHSACNCRCVMCDIWKDNKNLKQLTPDDVGKLMRSLKKLDTRRVLMSGGEALLNRNFFTLCAILKNADIKITLLTTGLSIKQHADEIVQWVDDLIVSLDGDEPLHDAIRNIPGAFAKLRDGVAHIRSINPEYPVTARTVIHRLNFRSWPAIIDAALAMGIDQISFLPADVSSHAFNRQQAWEVQKQSEILLAESELDELHEVVNGLLANYKAGIDTGFIAESAPRLMDIYRYYTAFYERNPFPFKKCNAPWVSAVIEAGGEIRPCFFMDSIGNIADTELTTALNSKQSVSFRKTLDAAGHPTCTKCVCSLNLSPLTSVA